jgi:hypothetical protein
MGFLIRYFFTVDFGRKSNPKKDSIKLDFPDEIVPNILITGSSYS